MIDLLQLLDDLVSSPWFYAVLLLISLLDAFLPVIPSEPAIIIAGVYSAAGDTDLLLVIAAVGVGAVLGDQIPYGLGRFFSVRMLGHLPTGTKRRRTYDVLDRELAARGGYVLIIARFIPVGRYLVTLTTGIVNYPYRRFVFFSAVGGMAWSAYTVLTGYLGGVLFQDNALVGIGVGLGLAVVMAGAVEAVQRLRRRPMLGEAPSPTDGTTEDELPAPGLVVP